MHLVFATSLVPDGAPSSGYEIANRAIIDAFGTLGVRLTIVGYAWPGKTPENPADTIVLGETDVKTGSASAATKFAWLAKSVTHGVPFSSGKLRLVEEAQLRAVLEGLGPVDGVVLNGVTLAGAYERLLTSKPFLFVAHNVEHVSARQNAEAAASQVERLMFAREARLLEALETRLCAGADYVFTLSEEDRAPLGVADPGRSSVLPLTTVRQAPAFDPARRPDYDLALIGTWTWAPNRIGLDWFLDEVVPLLPSDTDIRVAGSTPPELAARYPAVNFVGRVDDAAAFVKGARVIPLASRAGTGVQLKTIETFEYGLPSVATSSALRGIARVPANCVEADDARSFAAALASRIAESRAGKTGDVDGRAFHAAQRAGIADALEAGLKRLWRREAA